MNLVAPFWNTCFSKQIDPNQPKKRPRPVFFLVRQTKHFVAEIRRVKQKMSNLVRSLFDCGSQVLQGRSHWQWEMRISYLETILHRQGKIHARLLQKLWQSHYCFGRFLFRLFPFIFVSALGELEKMIVSSFCVSSARTSCTATADSFLHKFIGSRF